MPRKPTALTQNKLKAMRRKAEADPSYSSTQADAQQPGLYAQARRGKVRFLFRYRPPDGGGRRHFRLDWYGAITLKQARDAAQEYRGQLARGIDPLDRREAERRDAVTVREAVETYLSDLEQRAETGAKRGKRSGYLSAKRRLERNVLPTLGDRRLRDVTPDHVRKLHRGMKKTPSEANRTLTALSAVFGYADRAELVPAGTNPVRHVERFTENGRRRALTAGELQALGRVLQEAEAHGRVELPGKKGKVRSRAVHRSAVLAIRLLALTGMRRAEVLGHGSKDRRGKREGLRWGDVDLDAAVIHLHDSKTGKQKRVVGQAVVDLLREAKPEDAEDRQCVCPGAMSRDKPLVGLPRADLWKAAGIEPTAEGRADLHSLRHSFASLGAHAHGGRYAAFVSVLLGHGHQVRQGITQRYIHDDTEALRTAADAIAGDLARHLGLGEVAEVVEHPAARARDAG